MINTKPDPDYIEAECFDCGHKWWHYNKYWWSKNTICPSCSRPLILLAQLASEDKDG